MKLPEQIEAKRIMLKGLDKPSFQLAQNIYDVADQPREQLRGWLP